MKRAVARRRDSSVKGPVQKRPSSHFLKRKRRKGSYLTLTGKYPSNKTRWMNAFEGLRERDLMVLADLDDRVATFAPHPIKIIYKHSGRSRSYTPDLLIEYHDGTDGKPLRRPELCEVKLRLQLRKEWASLRPRFRAAQRYCRSKGWRFRLVTERVLRQPQMNALHFLIGFRRYEPVPAMVADLEQAVRHAFAPLSIKQLQGVLSELGHESGEALVQIWRQISLGTYSVDFDVQLSMHSVLINTPWTVAELIARPRSIHMEQKSPTSAAGPLPGDRSIGSAGSDVQVLAVGAIFGRTDRPGLYTLMQIDDPETVVVREHGTGALEKVLSSYLVTPNLQSSRERADAQALTGKELETATSRYEAIKAYVDQRRVSKEVSRTAAKEADVAAKTWRGWLRAYQRNPVLASLLRKRRSDAGESRLDPLVETLMQAYVKAWSVNTAEDIKSVWKDLRDEIKRRAKTNPSQPWKVPEYTTFYLRCQAVNPIKRDEGQFGKRMASLKHGLVKGSIAGIDAPLSIVQIDHTELPVQVVDEEFRIAVGRPWITVLIDIFSRMIVGFYLSLEPPGNLSAGLATANAILPKGPLLQKYGINRPWPCCGIMRVIHADSAGEFQGNMMELACKLYSIEFHARKLKQPNYGAHIEAYLGTLSEELKKVPGATLGGPDDLGDRKPERDAVMTLNELEEWLLWLFIEYFHREHSGLMGQSPISRWRDGFLGSASTPGLGKVHLPKDDLKLRLDFLPPIERVIDARGVLIDYIHYSDPLLQRWVNARDPKNVALPRQFLFRRDPRDLSRIYFWDPDERTYFVIPYRDATRPAITLWEHRSIIAFLKEQGRTDIDEEIIFDAREHRRRVLAEATNKAANVRRVKEDERRRQAERGSKEFRRDPPKAPEAPPPVVFDDSVVGTFEDVV